MRLPVFMIAALLLLPASEALAMRCGSGIIKEGDPADRVLTLCGDPDERDSFVTYMEVLRFYRGWKVRAVEVTPVRVDIWTYRPGRNRLLRRVRLEDGLVIRVETLDQRD